MAISYGISPACLPCVCITSAPRASDYCHCAEAVGQQSNLNRPLTLCGLKQYPQVPARRVLLRSEFSPSGCFLFPLHPEGAKACLWNAASRRQRPNSSVIALTPWPFRVNPVNNIALFKSAQSAESADKNLLPQNSYQTNSLFSSTIHSSQTTRHYLLPFVALRVLL